MQQNSFHYWQSLDGYIAWPLNNSQVRPTIVNMTLVINVWGLWIREDGKMFNFNVNFSKNIPGFTIEQNATVVLVSWKFNIDRVAIGKRVMWLAVKRSAELGLCK